MRCYNCNAEIPEGQNKCPDCGAKINKDYIRCPQCFISLKKNVMVCPNCGCNIKKTVLDEEKESKLNTPKTFAQKISDIPKWVKIAFPIAVVIVIALLFTGNYIHNSLETKEFKKYADEYIALSEECMDTVNALADEYNKAYDGKWLIQSENTQKLEKDFESDISYVREKRSRLIYLADSMQTTKLTNGEAAAAKKCIKSYNECYLYVIEKKGRYPGYMKEYVKKRTDCEKDLKNLKKIIK